MNVKLNAFIIFLKYADYRKYNKSLEELLKNKLIVF